jgi:hypothetical protein
VDIVRASSNLAGCICTLLRLGRAWPRRGSCTRVAGVMVSIVAFQAVDPGSIPGPRSRFLIDHTITRNTLIHFCTHTQIHTVALTAPRRRKHVRGSPRSCPRVLRSSLSPQRPLCLLSLVVEHSLCKRKVGGSIPPVGCSLLLLGSFARLRGTLSTAR